jgi:hypothetical protein
MAVAQDASAWSVLTTHSLHPAATTKEKGSAPRHAQKKKPGVATASRTFFMRKRQSETSKALIASERGG